MSKYGRALKAAGLRVVDKPRSGRPGTFGPVRGILLHHTAGRAPGDLSVVTNGRTRLPGPLSQFYLAPDGTWHVISEQRCNHAGLGQWNAGGLVIPKDEGNRYLLGLEVSSLGTKPISGKQLESLIEGVAALCELHGWNEKRVIRHKDYAGGRKVDIRNSLASIQQDIADQLTPPIPTPTGDDAMIIKRNSKTSTAAYLLAGSQLIKITAADYTATIGAKNPAGELRVSDAMWSKIAKGRTIIG